MRPVSPSIDPLAHRATIDALDAQRAAYRRYARNLEAQRGTLTDGDPDRAASAVDEAARGFGELQAGAQKLAPVLDHARLTASPDQLREIQQRVEELMHAAQSAEAAIHNLSSQLEVWRDAYGRQLAEVGITPGEASGGDDPPGADPTARPAPYGARGGGHVGPAAPRLLDRKV